MLNIHQPAANCPMASRHSVPHRGVRELLDSHGVYRNCPNVYDGDVEPNDFPAATPSTGRPPAGLLAPTAEDAGPSIQSDRRRLLPIAPSWGNPEPGTAFLEDFTGGHFATSFAEPHVSGGGEIGDDFVTSFDSQEGWRSATSGDFSGDF